MLRKPGTSAGTRTSRSRKVVKQTPEEIVRKIQRVPHNKKCADCTVKLPQMVNLNFNIFVCLACSGVHREFSHRVKGIGHSLFTEDEVERLQSPKAGNEAVNSVYLARYDPTRERLKAPTDDSDLQLLRVWIRRKYVDKAWLDYSYNEEEEEKTEIRTSKKNDEKKSKKKKSKSKENNSATIVSVPPKAAEVDLFGGWDTPKAESKPTHDPFSTMKSSNDNNQANDPFVADFNSQPNTQKNDPFAADFDSQPKSNKQSDAFAADFNSNSTTAKTDPFVADFNSQPNNNQNNGAFAADFNSQPNNNQNNGAFAADFNSQPNNNQNNGAFAADFNSQPNNNQNNGAFAADFNSQPNNQNNGAFSADFSSQSLDGNAKDDAFAADFSGMPNQVQQQQQQQPSFQANFGQNQAPNNELAPQMQGNSFSANFSQPVQSQPTQSSFNPSFENVPKNPEPSSSPAFGDFSAQNNQTMQQEPPQQMTDMKTEEKSDDPFDAFSGLSVSDKGPSVSSDPPKPKAESKYVQGQSIFYKERDGAKSQVTILKIHLDDDLEPFYTVKYPSGREKQTDDAHLTLSPDLDKVAENDETMDMNVATSNGQMPVNETENEFSSMPSNVNSNLNISSNNPQQQQQQMSAVQSMPTVQSLPVVQSMPSVHPVQPLGMDQMSQMVQNFSFQELLMMQQVINTKMQEIQMQQHSKMMAMSAGMQQTNAANNSPVNQMNSINSLNSVGVSNPASLAPPPPNEMPPPPPDVPPPPPPVVEKKGNPFDSF